MNDDESDFLPLRVIRECSNGKRRYDPEGKRQLIEACLLPGASIAGLALKAQVNANQLHKWIRLHERAKSARAAEDTVNPATTAFIPVVSVEHSYPDSNPQSSALPVSSSHRQSATVSRPMARLSAQLPNGVKLELECAGGDAGLVAAMVTALGAC